MSLLCLVACLYWSGYQLDIDHPHISHVCVTLYREISQINVLKTPVGCTICCRLSTATWDKSKISIMNASSRYCVRCLPYGLRQYSVGNHLARLRDGGISTAAINDQPELSEDTFSRIYSHMC